MNVRTTTRFILVAALLVSATGVFGAQQFGRDSVYAQAGNTPRSTASTVEITRFGRDSIYVTKDTVLSRPRPATAAALAIKPGRS
jgi:hypothetical protein